MGSTSKGRCQEAHAFAGAETAAGCSVAAAGERHPGREERIATKGTKVDNEKRMSAV